MPDTPQHPDRSAADYLPDRLSYPALCKAAERCRGCDLYKCATQVVFGAGNVKSRIILVGEQPGDEEDRTGAPFVGPAGQLLARAMEEAGLSREEVYVTNAVKHFKFILRGKKRLHQTPSPREVAACQPWLLAEIEWIKPKAILCLGATAAQSLLGRKFALTKNRGLWQEGPQETAVLATFHPSAGLRAPSHEARAQIYAAIVEDLKQVIKKAKH